ncbi:hypothetical protein SEUCBS139899_003196 [Sporothrix eucalyptigena]|uniref:Secreted protein n=1 Tax=Sporothrix eucalyptigena TaxID=1812306 RepID=A0ABP0B0E4_9PEZI
MATLLPLLTGLVSAVNSPVSGTPALLTISWTGQLGDSKENMTFYGNSTKDIIDQVHRYDPSYNTNNVESELTYRTVDSGTPEDLPDIGSPPMRWRGPGGPWEDYSKNGITYSYTCGEEGTADWYRTKDGATKLRNMGTDTCTTPANTCARHWCYDTTAMYVCNYMDTDLTIPYYNIGWMTDGLDRLCCDDNYGKSGQMWHYKLNYTTVLGYGDCNTDAATSQPYPMGAGNNGPCQDGSNDIFR